MQSFGFLNVNKPAGCTSHDIVAMLRKSFGIKRIGHSGTLDPFATGVLVIGLNEATRLFEYISSDKVYLAKITFGLETDTDDITGKVLKQSDIFPSLSEINKELQNFTGKIKQKPPIFSAIKIQGERAYKLARSNQISLEEISEKEVEIYSVDVVSYEEACHGMPLLKLRIHCSSGTYIRSIARDLGKALNTCAVLSALVRVKVGNCFVHEKSIAPESINNLNLSNHLISPLEVINLEKIHLSSKEVMDVSNGKIIKSDLSNLKTGTSLLLDNNNQLIAVATVEDDSIIKPMKVFNAK